MAQIHNFLISQWILIVVAFVLVSLPFIYHAKHFSAKVTDQICEELEKKCDKKNDVVHFEGRKVKLQVFTYTAPLKHIQDREWQKWRSHISSAGLINKNNILFLVDCLWAFLLTGLIYLTSSIRYTSFNNSKKILLITLITAYLLDVIENLAYMNLLGGLFKYLPVIGIIKLCFFIAAAILALMIQWTKKFDKISA